MTDPCCATFEVSGYHTIDCSTDLDPRATLAIPLPPRMTEVEVSELERDIRTAENAARVRAQTIAVYARQVCDTWPAVFEALRALNLDKGGDDNNGPRAGLYVDRIRLAHTALLAYTAAVARLNAALEA